MATTDHAAPPADTVAQRLLAEGSGPFRAAAHKAGLRGKTCPSNRTFFRAFLTGELEGFKLRGQWMTSPPAVIRWIERRRAKTPKPAPTISAAAADRILEAHGLGRRSES
jgi:hypothetical protein